MRFARYPCGEAALRISAIARVHGSLYRAAEVAITSTYLHDIMLMKAFATQLEGDVTFFSRGGGIVRIEGPIKIKQVSNPVSRRKPVAAPGSSS
jgi:hypothetical protein